MTLLNETHDPNLKSWVASANEAGSDFPIQNLPFGIFQRHSNPEGTNTLPRGCVAIGDQILALTHVLAKGLLTGKAEAAAEAALGSTLNPLMALGAEHWSALRSQLSALLREGGAEAELKERLIPMSEVEMCLPVDIGDYTDFYSSINHATNVGKLFRPDNPLLPNYKHIPIAYHGRSSSIRVSGTPAKRPMGQLKAPDAELPVLTACKRLDYETELGVFVGPGNELGETIPLDEAEDHIFGFCVLNDWSARDIQAWEYQPLGPFLAKNFATTISPWIVTMEAMAPYRQGVYQRPADDPQPLAYLTSDAHEKSGGLNIVLDVAIATEKMRSEGQAPMVVGTPVFKDMYWSVFQMLTHHASGGCNLQPGDFYGSGTISGTSKDQLGSLLEATVGGKETLEFPNGETRTFLEDGDEVVMRAWCEQDGAARIGFGECRSVILPASG
ncbi:MAG: fumarylacetoacetase [Rhodospirillaceae bacterium]|nr:fumarylacetoacetase [Rhodospirillaceae bacterium]MBT4938877.1 fumarylacetoacetase [Rhodospirillaceae bacterium]MBT5939668.1 fumarylacetoacetase [Rhodospirillaceae bacterium]MBT7267785.1 fumarylacetoacetase [Rhodospirillaceae bacterium]